MKSNYLVCYDIADEARLHRVFKYLKERGFHVQYSVFHLKLTWQELQELKLDLKALIKEEEDDIRIYPLPLSPKVFVLGRGNPIPDEAIVF